MVTKAKSIQIHWGDNLRSKSSVPYEVYYLLFCTSKIKHKVVWVSIAVVNFKDFIRKTIPFNDAKQDLMKYTR
ncbi:hypothetical protein MHTCC0001_09420 [Flavobacteriaceae bacterium MHTCC 0001]